jgi:hypothetical protein
VEINCLLYKWLNCVYKLQCVYFTYILEFEFIFCVIFFPFFIVLLGGVTLWHLQKFLQCIKYIILGFITYTILLYHPSLIPGIASTVIIFPLHACKHSIHPPTPFPHYLPLSLVPNPYFLAGHVLPSSPIL